MKHISLQSAIRTICPSVGIATGYDNRGRSHINLFTFMVALIVTW
jgi:hypothetical protein